MNEILPNKLIQNIGSERKEFVVKSKRDQPIGKIVKQLYIGFFFFMFTIIIFIENGSSRGYSFDFANFFVGFFVLTGILIIISSIDMLLKKGSLYIGTPKRLIIYRKGDIKSIQWKLFTGDLMTNDNSDGYSILFKMRNINGDSKYSPEEIYISGIENLQEVEEICRRRIKEHDPTPSTNTREHNLKFIK